MSVCLLLQMGYFVVRDAVSAAVSADDRFAEVLILMMFVCVWVYLRHPRIALIASAACAVGIAINLEYHSDDHSASAILARNLLLIAYFIIGSLGIFPRTRDNY